MSVTTSPGYVASPFLQSPKHANRPVGFRDPKLWHLAVAQSSSHNREMF